MSITRKGFAFLNQAGKFVNIGETTGHTGKKIFVSEVEMDCATILPSPEVLHFYKNVSSFEKSELMKLTPVPATETRSIVIG